MLWERGQWAKSVVNTSLRDFNNLKNPIGFIVHGTVRCSLPVGLQQCATPAVQYMADVSEGTFLDHGHRVVASTKCKK